MRKSLITLLILLMAVLPAWSAAAVCHHTQQAMPQVMGIMGMEPESGGHDCCPDMHQHTAKQATADTCHCDQFQHGQFVLGLLDMPFARPESGFLPPATPLLRLPERTDTLYRPPIA